jgi:hypothetical protein
MLVQDFRVETDLFLRRKSVQHAADRIHFARDVFGRAPLRAFENHVFEEMREPVFGRDFAAGAVAYPDADRDGADVLHGFGDDHQAVR